MKNIDIGKQIIELLTKDEELTKLVGKKIFPLVANADTTFPFVVYKRAGFQPALNKDYEGEKITVDFVICSTKYEESLKIANKIYQGLVHVETDIIDDSVAINLYEDYISDTYCQFITIIFTLK